ncbi:MAG: hypothetical protein ACREDS_00805, partial [Limisphaerales bacterium]
MANDWWQNESPELVLSNAQAVTRNLAFLHAEKLGSPFSQISNLFAKTNSNARVEFFQRKNADGSVESKNFTLNGNFQLTDYKLKSGEYVFTEGQIIKMEHDLDGYMEKITAAKFIHPYEYKFLKPEMVGTNNCIVVARCMTPKFLDAMKAVLYKNYTKEQEDAFGGDPRKFIRSETDYYVRKNDAVVMGKILNNYLGEQLENWLYDKVEINQPIATKEFSLPKGDIKIASSTEELEKIVNESRAAKRAKSPQKQTAT